MPILAQIEQLQVNVAICDDIDLADTSNDSPNLFEMKFFTASSTMGTPATRSPWARPVYSRPLFRSCRILFAFNFPPCLQEPPIFLFAFFN